jgi:hypothetical protein
MTKYVARIELHIEDKLARLTGAEDDIRDTLNRYTTVVSGTYCFVLSVETLSSFASSDDK